MKKKSALPSGKSLLTCLLFILISVSCSKPVTPKVTSKTLIDSPSPVTAQIAFHRVFVQAKAWSGDSQLLKISSFNLKNLPSNSGKCAVWQAIFVSRTKRKSRSYTYSVIKAGRSIRKGMRIGLEESWSGRGRQKPFIHQLFRIDSDKAFFTAREKSETFLKKNPNLPVHFLLESTARFTSPVWRVIWGETVGSSKRTIFVDASTGLFLGQS